MDFFCNCKTEQERKDLYRQLSKCFHPDKNGTDYLMSELNRQYSTPIQRESFHQKIMGNHIPFDHPIHEEIKLEKKRVEYLRDELMKKEDSISILLKFKNDLSSKNAILIFENDLFGRKIKTLEIEKEDSYKKISEMNEDRINSERENDWMAFILFILSIIIIVSTL